MPQVSANQAFDANGVSEVRIEFAGGSELTVDRSVSGTNYFAAKIYDQYGKYDSVNSAGVFFVEGGFLLKFSSNVVISSGELK